MIEVAALFVDPEGPYIGIPRVDPWDESRDARTYRGPWPVVSHPPCQRWGRFARGAPGHPRFKVGDDGGCFAAAVEAVRTYGGVIEHPMGSLAWRAFRLPIPRANRRRSAGWTPADEWGGRSCHVDQGTYDHKCQKPTWLYAVLPSYPALRWGRTWGSEWRIGGQGYHSARERARAKARNGGLPTWKDLPKSERHITPPAFRDELIALAAGCVNWRPRRVSHQSTLPGVDCEVPRCTAEAAGYTNGGASFACRAHADYQPNRGAR